MKNFKPRKNLNHNIYTGCTLLKHLAFASCFMHLHFYNYWTERQYRKKNSEKLWYCSLESVLHAYLCNTFDMCSNFRLLVWCKWIFNCPTPLTLILLSLIRHCYHPGNPKNVAFFCDNPQKSSLFHLLRALFLLHLDEFGFHCDCMRLVTFLKKKTKI